MTAKEYIEKHNIQSEDLDDVVHDTASQMASNANNGGIDEQIQVLKNGGWTDNQIIFYLKD